MFVIMRQKLPWLTEAVLHLTCDQMTHLVGTSHSKLVF